MAHSNVPPGEPSGKPSDSSDNILANLSRLTELRLGVTADATLGCVCISVDGLGDGISCLIAPGHAIEMASRLTAAVMRLRRLDLGPPDLGPGSLSSTVLNHKAKPRGTYR